MNINNNGSFPTQIDSELSTPMIVSPPVPTLIQTDSHIVKKKLIFEDNDNTQFDVSHQQLKPTFNEIISINENNEQNPEKIHIKEKHIKEENITRRISLSKENKSININISPSKENKSVQINISPSKEKNLKKTIISNYYYDDYKKDNNDIIEKINKKNNIESYYQTNTDIEKGLDNQISLSSSDEEEDIQNTHLMNSIISPKIETSKIINNEIDNLLNKYSDSKDNSKLNISENIYNTSLESNNNTFEKSILQQYNYDTLTLMKSSSSSDYSTKNVKNKSNQLLNKKNEQSKKKNNKAVKLTITTTSPQKNNNSKNINKKTNKTQNKSNINKKIKINKQLKTRISNKLSSTSSDSGISSPVSNGTPEEIRINNQNKNLSELYSIPISYPTFPYSKHSNPNKLIFPSPSEKKSKSLNYNSFKNSSNFINDDELININGNTSFLSNEDEYLRHRKLFKTIGKIKDKKINELEQQLYSSL